MRDVDLLGENDIISVYAVDSVAHEMVPPLQIGPHRSEIRSRVRRIQSMGGGIYVYEGLEAGWNALQTSDVGQRHLILFSDAADSEHPHKYKQLVKEMVAGGTTVTVIALGTDKDTDANFLKDIAARGGGRIFFTTDATTLPNIFAQETVSVARSTFITDPTGAKTTGRFFEIAERDLNWLPEVDGYNLSYLRENCSQALVTTDEYVAPLVATGQRGVGRSAAISFAMGGEYSERIRAWPELGDFVQTTTRWLMGEDLPEGIGVRSRLDGTELMLDLIYNEDEWSEKFAVHPPKAILAEGRTTPSVRDLVWERIRPGVFSAGASLEPGKMVRGAIQVGDTAIPFGPLVVGSDTEWIFEPARRREIRELSEATGGRELLDLEKAWLKPPRESYASLQPWLFTLFLVLALLEALSTRLGWAWPKMGWLRRKPRPALAEGADGESEEAGEAAASKPGVFARSLRRKRPRKGKEEAGRTEAPAPEAPEPPPLPSSSKTAKKKPKPKPKPKEEPKPDGAERARSRFQRAKKRK